jgi:thioredoxin-like negative regulator of GroEL
MRVGRELEAFHAWQRVAQLRSSAAQIHLQAATGAVRAGDREQARAKLEEAWQFDPTNDEIVFALARLRRQMGDVAGAAGLLENHLRQSAESPWAVSYLAQLSEELGRRDVALLMLQRYQAITGLPWRPVPE